MEDINEMLLVTKLEIDSENEELIQDTPEKRLLCSILERAILDLKSSDNTIRREATKWFNSQEEDYIFSFFSICEFLNLNQEKLKRILNKYKKNI